MQARPGEPSTEGGTDRSGPGTAAPVMDRLRPRAREIVMVARQLLEDEGLESFSMRKLADRLGVRAPVIYKHFASKNALVAALISLGFQHHRPLFNTTPPSSHPPLT